MKRTIITTICVILVSALAQIGISFLTDKSDKEPKSGDSVSYHAVKKINRDDFARKRKALLEKRQSVEQFVDFESFKEKEKPILDDLKEEEQLTDLQREILVELRRAFDSNDKQAVLAIVQRMQAIASASGKNGKGWESSFPASIRKMAIQALGWFGADSLPELAAFLADPDPTIAELAMSQVEAVLTDIELGDKELSPQIIALLSVIDSPDAVDSLMSSIPMRMRNSVGIKTIIEVARTGTDAAVAKVPETISFFTGDSSINTVEAALEWLQTHPDNEFDDQLYGSIKAFFGDVELVPKKFRD